MSECVDGTRRSFLGATGLALAGVHGLLPGFWAPAGTGTTGVVNVRDWGAKGDGKTDDSDAIQRAVLHAATTGGGVVFVPPTGAGYRVGGTVRLCSDVSLYGMNSRLIGSRENTLLSSGYLDRGAIKDNRSATYGVNGFSRSLIHGLFLTDAKQAIHLNNANFRVKIDSVAVHAQPGGHGIRLQRSFGVELSNAFLHGNNFRGAAGRFDAVGVWLDDNGNGVSLHNLYVHAFETGIRTSGSARAVSLINCIVEHALRAVDLHDGNEAVTIQGSYFEKNELAIGLAAQGTAGHVKHATIDGNYFYDNATDIACGTVRNVYIGPANAFDGGPTNRTRVTTEPQAIGVAVDLGFVDQSPALRDPALDLGQGVAQLSWTEMGAGPDGVTEVRRIAHATAPPGARGVWRFTGAVEAMRGFRQTIDGWHLGDLRRNQRGRSLARLGQPADEAAGFFAPRGGSVTGLAVRVEPPCRGGSLRIRVLVGGRGTPLEASVDPGTPAFMPVLIAPATVQFRAGDLIGLEATTDSGWEPAGATIRCVIDLET